MKKSKAVLRRSNDHCSWKFKKRSLLRACREGAATAVDEARHEAPSLGSMKRLVDCSVQCNGDQLDFNVWPRKGEPSSEACLRKAKAIRPDKKCDILRYRSIDGLRKDQVETAERRAYGRCSSEYTKKGSTHVVACQDGIASFVNELRQEKPSLDKATTRHLPIRFNERFPRVKITRE